MQQSESIQIYQFAAFAYPAAPFRRGKALNLKYLAWSQLKEYITDIGGGVSATSFKLCDSNFYLCLSALMKAPFALS